MVVGATRADFEQFSTADHLGFSHTTVYSLHFVLSAPSKSDTRAGLCGVLSRVIGYGHWYGWCFVLFVPNVLYDVFVIQLCIMY